MNLITTYTSRIVPIGIKVETPDGFFISRGMLLLTTVDLPARAILCNMKQHSGAHACCTCEDLGDNTLGKTRLHRVWPFTASCKIRTPESVANAFRSATNTGKAVSIHVDKCNSVSLHAGQVITAYENGHYYIPVLKVSVFNDLSHKMYI